MEDRRIVQLLWARAESAIDAMQRKYGPRLLSTAKNILDSLQDAEETVSDTYLAVWDAVPPRKPEPLAGFVYKIGRNLALKRLRDGTARKRDSRYDLSLEELESCIPGPALEDALEARELGRMIDAFLSNVSRENRNIFLRRYWFGDSVRDIAHSFRLRESTVNTRLSRLRGQLRDYLIKEGYFDE